MSFIPNTTPTPNWLYNGEMKKMNETELKVVLLITRKTLGWFDPTTQERKTQDYISQAQFVEFTGQGSYTSIARAIQTCVEHGWITARDKKGQLVNSPEKRARRKVWYQLGSVFTDKISGTQSEPESGTQSKPDGKMTTSSGTQNDTHLVHKVYSTKETITKESIILGNAEQSSDIPGGLVINKFIFLLKEINPSYELFFARKNQREACGRLLKLHDINWWSNFLPTYRKELENNKFCPRATSPIKLEEKLGDIELYGKSKNKLSNNRQVIL